MKLQLHNITYISFAQVFMFAFVELSSHVTYFISYISAHL